MYAIRWTLDHPVAVFTAAATCGLLAAASFAVIAVKLSPPSELPELRLNAQWPGASAFTVESEVTRPLESLVQQLDHVTSIRSQTREGRAELVVQFDAEAHIGLLEVELNERIHQHYEIMPEGVLWPVIQRSVPEELADLAGFLSYRLYGDRRPGELREYAQVHLQKALLAVADIKDVQLEGGKVLELAVEIDGNAAASVGLSSEDISEQFADKLARHKRIRDVDIDAVARYSADEPYEMIGRLDARVTGEYGLDNSRVAEALRRQTTTVARRRLWVAGELQDMAIKFRGASVASSDEVRGTGLGDEGRAAVRLGDLIQLEKSRIQPEIVREDQTYMRRINLNYLNYLGAREHGEKLIDLLISRTELPYGFSIARQASY